MSERRQSQLRSQLNAARDEYGAARYNGDLAFDVLPSRMSIALGRAGWALGAVAAVAAVVSILVMIRRTPSSGVVAPPTVALVDQTRLPTSMPATPFSISAESIASSDSDTWATTTTAELPLAAAPPGPPTEVTSFVPSYQSIAVESVPSFPSFDSVRESQQQEGQQQDQSNVTNSREAS